MIDLAALKSKVSDSLTQAQAAMTAFAAMQDVVAQHNALLAEIEAAESAVPSVADVKAMIAKLPG